MKTRDFIKILQEADPTGDGYIRMADGIPYFAEAKAGYWDGAYSYIDENENLVYSTQHYKVDIYSRNTYDFVEGLYNHFDKERNTWDYIKSKIKFDFTYSIPEQRKEREDAILKRIKAEFDDCVQVHENIWQKELEDALKHVEEGWTWFQNKEVDNKDLKPNMHYYYTWKIYNKDGKDQGSNPYNTQPVLYSGLFERLDNNKKPGYYEWIYKK